VDRRNFIKNSLVAAGTACSSKLPFCALASTLPKQILVLGGTLFLGPALVDALVAGGHTVTLFNRGITNPELFPHLEKLKGFRSADADDQDLSALAHRRSTRSSTFGPMIPMWLLLLRNSSRITLRTICSSPRLVPTTRGNGRNPALLRKHPWSPGIALGARTTATKPKVNAE